MILEELINCKNLNYEILNDFDEKNPILCLKTIAGFANASGGNLFIGVENHTNKLIGFDRVEANKKRNTLNHLINNYFYPLPKINFRFINFNIHEEEKYLIRVTVEESIFKPVVLNYNDIPSIYMRRNNFTDGALYEEIVQMIMLSSAKSYDKVFTDMKFDKDDFIQLIDFYNVKQKNNFFNDDYLLNIGFYDENKNLSNGAILFKDDYVGNKCKIKVTLYAGLNKKQDYIVISKSLNYNIIKSLNYALELVKQYMNYSNINEKNSSTESYPFKAVREGLINAIIHRDYFIENSQIEVNIFNNRIEISAPGSCCKGYNNLKSQDIKDIKQKQRNSLISSILLGKNQGEELNIISRCYKNCDLQHSPYISSVNNFFTLVLPNLNFEEGIINKTNLTYVPIVGESQYDYDILEYCLYIAKRVSEIAKYLGLSNSTFLRKNILKNLVDQNYLIMNKCGNTMFYRTNSRLVKNQ